MTRVGFGALGLFTIRLGVSSPSVPTPDPARRVNLLGYSHAPAKKNAKFEPGSWKIRTANGERAIPANEQTPFVLADGRYREVVHISTDGTIFFFDGDPADGTWMAPASESWIEMFNNNLIT